MVLSLSNSYVPSFSSHTHIEGDHDRLVPTRENIEGIDTFVEKFNEGDSNWLHDLIKAILNEVTNEKVLTTQMTTNKNRQNMVLKERFSVTG